MQRFFTSGTISCRFRSEFLLFVAIAFATSKMVGQAASHSAHDSEIESHFATAQKAQRDQDYSTAEREYLSVIALAPDFAEVHMNLGLVYQLQGKPSEAIQEFHRALKLKPSLIGANFFLGVDYCKAGEGKKAIPYLKAAVKADPSGPDIWLWLARAQEISGQPELEVETLLLALKSHPKNSDLLYTVGNAYERLGKQEVTRLGKVASGSARSEQLLAESYAASNEWPTAVIHFQNALNATPHPLGLHVELGEVLLRAGKIKPAIKEFDDELRTDPGNLRALVRRGEAKLIQKDVDAALHDWDQAIAIDSDQVERILGIRETGFGDAALEQLPDAAREQLKALSGELQSRNSPASHLGSAFLDAQHGDLAQAEQEASLAKPSSTKSFPRRDCSETSVKLAIESGRTAEVATCAGKVLTPHTTAEFRIRVAAALLADGDPQTTLTILQGLPPADRNSPEASYWRARCYERLATSAYLQLYQADANSYRLHQLMGDLEETKGDDVKAIEEYRSAVALQPSVPNLHYSLGHVLWKDLKVPEARAEFEAELAIDPNHAGALNELGDTYLLEHQPDKAISYLIRALAVDAGNPDLQRDLGTAYSELGDYRRAEEHYKIAVLADHDGSVHYKLGKVYQALGEKESAAHEFALSTALNHESHSKLEKQTQRIGEITRSAEDP